MIEQEYIDFFVQVYLGGFAVGLFIGCCCFAISMIFKAIKFFSH